MKIKLLLLSIATTLLISLNAQQSDIPTPILKSSDVEMFIKEFKAIESEFKTIDYNLELESNIQSSLEELKDLDEANSIIKKHGYADFADFTTKTWAITSSYLSILLESGNSPELEKAIKEIEADPNMPEEQKIKAKAQIQMIMQGMQQALSSSANKENIETVRPYTKKLEQFFETDKE